MTESGYTGAGNPLFVWIRGATASLREIEAGNPQLEAEYLMAAALGIPRIQLWLTDNPPDAEALRRFEALLARRLAREPLQYVLGTAEFADLTLTVCPGVFIPRSETEVLVERVQTRLSAMLGGCSAAPRIVDVGTGTGAILLALLGRLPGAIGLGIDTSPDALACAQRNAERLELSNRAQFCLGNLLEGLDRGILIDAIVSNPPYIRVDEGPGLAPEIREYEPSDALFAGEDGLDVIRRIVPQAAERLPSGGLLGLEIGITQADAVAGLLGGGDWRDVEIRPDMAGRPRVVMATRS